MAPISLTLTFDTAEQAHHVLEAYNEARGFTTHSIDNAREARLASERAAGILPPANAPFSQHQQAIASLPAGPMGNANAGIGQHPSAHAASAPNAGPVGNVPSGVAPLAPQTVVTTGSTAANLDARGVPHHPDHHGENKTQQGYWKRKRGHNSGHNKAAADAYEAMYLSSPAPVAQTAQPGMPSSLPPAPSAPVQPAAPVAQVYEAPAVRYLPSAQEYDEKWISLCKAGKVTGNHQKMIETKFGAHPCSPQVRDVEENRRQIWVAFLAWEAGDTGAAV